MKIALGYAPAPDGGVMFFGLAAGQVDTGELEIDLLAAPLAVLNDRASRGELEATMISAAAYPYLREKYVLARCAASFARGRGPVLAAPEPLDEQRLATAVVAVPDSTSSALVALQLSRPGMRTRLLPADKIAQATRMGLADCALLPDTGAEGCRRSGLHCVADLGVGWARQSGNLPLPLTCLAIRADLDADLRLRIEQVVRQSIRYGMAHRAEAVRFALQQARNGAGCADADEAAVGLYVSDSALDIEDPDRRALEEFLRRGSRARLVPDALPIRFVEGA